MAEADAGEKLKVFISYSRKDSAFADELLAGLEVAGFAPFLDRHDIVAGENWEKRLGGLIEQSDTVVFVISPEAVKSDHCVWEVNRTIELSKRVLPVIFKPVPTNEIPEKLSSLQFVSFDSGRGVTRPLAELADALRQDVDWIREHTRLGELARRWEGRVRPESLLLRGDDLGAAKAWMATRKGGAPEITDAQRALISASEEAEAKRLGNERAQLEREKAQVAEIKAAQARTARLNLITRWAFAAVGAVIVIAGGIVGWLQWDKAQQLAGQEVALAESSRQLAVSTQKLVEAQANVSAEHASNAALKQSLDRQQVELEHAQANFLAALSRTTLMGSEIDSALRLASHGARIDAGLPSDIRKASPAAVALAVAVSQTNWHLGFGGHEGDVRSAAFSPDGSRIVTASDDKTARIWDAATAKEIAVLRGHEGSVNSAAFSPDGSRIVTASNDKTARIWDAAAAKEIAVLHGHEGSVNSAAFSRDGSRIVTASNDKTARIWDSATGKQIAVLRGHDFGVRSAAFSPDGSRIVTASDYIGALGGVIALLGGTIRIQDAATGKQIVLMRDSEAAVPLMSDREGAVRSAAFSPDGSRIVTASGDGIARIRHAATGTLIAVLRGHGGAVQSAAFSPDGSRIVTASSDNTVRIWDAATAKEIAVLRGHEGSVNSAAFSPDGSRIVTASNDKTARIWAAVSAKEIAVLSGHEGRLRFADFNPDGSRIVTASDDKTARIWASATGKQIAVLRGHEGDVRSAAFSPDGSRIVTASNDKTARIWDAATAKEIAVLRSHEGSVKSAAFSPDGSRIVTASDDKTARIWDAASAREITVLRGHEGSVNSAAFSPDGSRIVTAAAEDKTARIWDAASAREIAVLLGHKSYLNSAAFSPDGSRIVTAADDSTARIWDAVSAKEIAVLRSHSHSVESAAFSRDGSRIVTAAADDHAVRIWDAVSAKEIALLRAHGDLVWSAAFSPDGSRIVTTSADDSTARIWDVRLQTMSVGDLLAQSCARLSGVTKLSRDEMRLAGYPESMPEIDVCTSGQ
jgi:WD40 repeat protein